MGKGDRSVKITVVIVSRAQVTRCLVHIFPSPVIQLCDSEIPRLIYFANIFTPEG